MVRNFILYGLGGFAFLMPFFLYRSNLHAPFTYEKQAVSNLYALPIAS